MQKNPHVIINGGGLVGALAAIYLLRHTPHVTVVEKREDLRNADAEAGRSINLVLTSRGLYALRQVGLEKEALNLCVKVEGRVMHSNKINEPTVFQPYGLLQNGEVNYSVSRTNLNRLLIEHAERRGARFFFKHELTSLDLPLGLGVYKCKDGLIQMEADLFLGCDGVGSQTRIKMIELLRKKNTGKKEEIKDDMERLGISYKELTFPARLDKPSSVRSYPMESNGLHIWPRGSHFLMALADKEQSFTGTLYLPDGSAQLPTESHDVPTFESLQNDKAKYAAYFEQYFPDVPAIVPDFKEQLTSREHGFLATVRTSHWRFEDKCLLLGDAGHGIVPFFGQGMNLGFESVVVFDRFLRQGNLKAKTSASSVAQRSGFGLAHLSSAIDAYVRYHYDSAVAIADMAIENFTEMSFRVGQESFLIRKKAEHVLETRFPTKFRSRYYLVTKTLVPYKTVQQAGYKVDEVIDAALQEVRRVTKKDKITIAETEEVIKQLPEKLLVEMIDKYLTPFFHVESGNVKRETPIEVGNPLKVYYPLGEAGEKSKL